MSNTPEESKKRTPSDDTEAYEPPAIVYEGTIATRAGSPVLRGQSDGDPGAIDLFVDPDE